MKRITVSKNFDFENEIDENFENGARSRILHLKHQRIHLLISSILKTPGLGLQRKTLYCRDQGDQMFLLKNCPKTLKNRPKSHPTMFLLNLLYKTVLWCFLFDFMLISNGTGHSFIVFYIKKEIKCFE